MLVDAKSTAGICQGILVARVLVCPVAAAGERVVAPIVRSTDA